jgi:hypothetical protein
MFVLCPHCQFLVALTPSGAPPERCPRCSERLQPDAATDDTNAATTPAVPRVAPEPPRRPSDEAGVADSAVTEASVATTVDIAAPGPPGDTGDAIASVLPAAGDAPVHIEIDRDTVSDAAQAAAPQEDEDAPPAARIPATAALVAAGHHRPARTLPRAWTLATAPVLFVVLVVQSLLADRAQLAADAHWRPVVVMACHVLQCTVPPWHEPEAFTLLDRNVRAARPGVLHVTANFRNDARWAQPWPSMLLTLSDADGRIAGERLFTPVEYLGREPTQNGLASGQRASVSMDVVEPARDVVAFTFDFR